MHPGFTLFGHAGKLKKLSTVRLGLLEHGYVTRTGLTKTFSEAA